MKHMLLVVLATASFVLAGCAMENQIQRENAQAESECRNAGLQPGKRVQGSFQVTADEMKWTACIREHRQSVRVAADFEACKSKGLVPGTPAMTTCVANLGRARSDQIAADFQGALAQMGR